MADGGRVRSGRRHAGHGPATSAGRAAALPHQRPVRELLQAAARGDHGKGPNRVGQGVLRQAEHQQLVRHHRPHPQHCQQLRAVRFF